MPSALDNSVDRVRKHRANVRENGGAAISVLLQPGDDATAWKRLVMDHGGPTPALRFLIRLSIERADVLSNADLARMVAARLAQAPEPEEAVRPEPKKSQKQPRKSS